MAKSKKHTMDSILPPMEKPLNVDMLKKLLTSEDTFATTLLVIIVDNYSTEAFSWEPETLVSQLKDDFGVELPKINQDKIWALITALTTNMFYTSFEMFTHICEALNNETPSFNVFDPPSLDQVAWGISEVILNDSDNMSPDPNLFSTEVRRFIGVLLDYNDISDAPDVLSIAERPEQPEGLDDAPEMLQAKMQRELEAGQELRAFLVERLRQLLAELDAVPLRNRKAKEWDEFSAKVSGFLNQTLKS